MQQPYAYIYYTIRGAPIRVARVVVVDVPARVHIPRIAPVPAVRTTQAHVLFLAYSPIINRYSFP